MNQALYNPFTNFDFKEETCFLSGFPANKSVQILPNWLLEMAGLTGEEQIKLLDEAIHTYKSLNFPINTEAVEKELSMLEDMVSKAFSEGYSGVKALPKDSLFQWIGKFLFGLIYIEMNKGIKQKVLSPDGMNMGQSLMHKYGNLHAMVQSVCRPIIFENFKPYSILIVELEDNETPFSFRDEINTMTFSLKFKNFGIIACLQDNGVNEKYHDEVLKQVNNVKLSGPQFEELCARFYYSAYLFNRLPEYNIMLVNEEVFIEAMPLKGMLNKPIFDQWQHKTYAQVLENFWKPWGHLLFEIMKNPEAPMTYFNLPALPGD